MGKFLIVAIIALAAFVMIGKTMSDHKQVAQKTKQMKKSEDIDIDYVYARAVGGHALSQYLYGLMCANGEVVGQGDKDAVYWMTQAAEQGHIDAWQGLGDIYWKVNPTEAAKYYRVVAENGDIGMCKQLATEYAVGDVLPKDEGEAYKLFLKAAELGDPECQWMVGHHLFYGQGVEENPEEAFKWYMKSAEQGYSEAEYEIGEALAIGGDDIEAARKWYTKAAQHGSERAQKKLEVL